MHLEVADNPDEDRYEIRADGELAGYLIYHRRGERIALNHTEVLDGFEGKGVGSALARGALDHVRSEGGKLVARCPFIAEFLRRHVEYGDLVDTELTARRGAVRGRRSSSSPPQTTRNPK